MITIRHTRAEGTLLEGSTRGDGVYEIVKRHGFTWRPAPGIFVRGSRDRRADTDQITAAAEALRAAGHEVSVEIDDVEHRPVAEVEAGKYARVADRAERLADAARAAQARSDAADTALRARADLIPLGQPILVGHHSQRRAERDRDFIDAKLGESVAEYRRSQDLAAQARVAAGFQDHREALPVTLRRIQRLETEERDLRRKIEHARECGDVEWEQRLSGRLVDVEADLAYWRDHVTARQDAGEKVWGPDDFTKGDLVESGLGVYEVLRVNRKSLTVPSGYSWTNTLPYDKVTGRRPAPGAGRPERGGQPARPTVDELGPSAGGAPE